MDSYVKLGIVGLLPVVTSAIVFILDEKTRLGKMNKWAKQIIIGVVFGLLAVLGTEWSIPVEGAVLNCRDAAVITAGLFFGAPAGILAGFIGGLERWIAVAWGVGSFTRIACSVSTFLAGLYAASLRKFMFENKKPGWLISCAVGTVMEVFHLTMVFLTNMNQPYEAMEIIRICAVPMVVANGISVMLSGMILSLLSHGKDRLSGSKKKQARISQTIQKWLLVAIFTAFAATSFFVFKLQDRMAAVQADKLLTMALDETEADIRDALTGNLLSGSSVQDIDIVIADITKNRHVGETGFILIIDEEYNVISAPESLKQLTVRDDADAADVPEADVTFRASLNAQNCNLRYRAVEGYYIVSVLPENEVLYTRDVALYVNSFMEIIVFAVLFGLIYQLIRHVVVDRIKQVNCSLKKITEGNLNEVVNVRSNDEFTCLSDDINLTVGTLKQYIEEASARVDRELEVAKNIQRSALPCVFPAFPKRKDFDIFASMDPAREVGGDFYDFYFTSNDTLNILIADVSGKGIPAAMFMMRAKTELKSLTESELNLSDVFTHANERLCEGNDAGMFVTAWQGCINLSTGFVSYVNAGHNPPLVRHSDGTFEFIKTKPGFVMAGMEGIKYRTDEIQLNPGDILYLYTDGVTEAMNAKHELYGNDRLCETLNRAAYKNMQELCKFVKADVDSFAGEELQFDDITMVAFQYVGKQDTKSIHFDKADLSDISRVTEFSEHEMERIGCDAKTIARVNVAIDEIFSNIVRYGYPNEQGSVTVEIGEQESPDSVFIRFTDEGIPYNPILAKEPDVSLSAEERDIGGLGIYMVKKTMDDVQYRYENGKNILTVRKNI